MYLHHLFGYKISQCLYVAAKLNIADHLLPSPRPVEELAKINDCQVEPLYRVLRCLVSLGYFDENPARTFSLNEQAKVLLENNSTSYKYFTILCGEELYEAAGKLLYSVKTGNPSFNYLYNMNHWEFLEKNSDKSNIFNQAMSKGSEKNLPGIINNYDFTPYSTIVDVGGGKGHLLCEVLKSNSKAIGINYDLPHAEELATEHTNLLNLSARYKFVSGDFFESVPYNADLYILKVIIHDWDDEKAICILRNCYKAMKKDSRLIIIEKIIEDNNSNDLTFLGDINMLVTLGGKERTIEQYSELLNKASLRVLNVYKTSSVFSIIEAAII